MLLLMQQNINQFQIFGGPAGVVKKRVKIDDKLYLVDPMEELLLVQAHMDALREQVREVRIELKKEKAKLKPKRDKRSRRRDGLPPRKVEFDSLVSLQSEKRVNKLLETLKTLQNAQRRDTYRVKKIRQKVRNDEALALILTLM